MGNRQPPRSSMFLRQDPLAGRCHLRAVIGQFPHVDLDALSPCPNATRRNSAEKSGNLEHTHKRKRKWPSGASDGRTRFISRSKLSCTGGRIDPGPSVPRCRQASASLWRQHTLVRPEMAAHGMNCWRVISNRAISGDRQQLDVPIRQDVADNTTHLIISPDERFTVNLSWKPDKNIDLVSDWLRNDAAGGLDHPSQHQFFSNSPRV